jgi:molybdate transport system permease protein
VFAAASLTDVLSELADRFVARTGVRLRFHLGPSEALATQIGLGAPGDLFISAGRQPMDRLESEGRLLPGSRIDLLRNRIVVVTPASREVEIRSLSDLGGGEVERIAIGDPQVAPAGRYAVEALQRSDLWPALRDRMVPANHVRTALAFVASGEADAGIVYATDARVETGVGVAFEIPEALHSPIVYPAALIEGGESLLAARRFLDYLHQPAARSLFARSGFLFVGGESLALDVGPSERAVAERSRRDGPASFLGPLWISVRVAGLSVLLGLPVALLCARVLTRRKFPGKLILETALNLPLVLPPVATGYFLLLLLSREGPLGWIWSAAGISFVFTWEAAALAASMISFPLMLRAAQVAFESIDPRLPAMARTLGATRRHAFFTVTLPLAFPGVLAAALLGFARSLGEFGATMMVAGNIPGVTQTLPMAIFNSVQIGSNRVALGLCALSVLLAFGSLAAIRLIEGMRRSGGPT